MKYSIGMVDEVVGEAALVKGPWMSQGFPGITPKAKNINERLNYIKTKKSLISKKNTERRRAHCGENLCSV